MSTVFSGDRQSTEPGISSQQWLRDNRIPSGENGLYSYNEKQIADLKALADWIPWDEIRVLDASSLQSVLGDDGMFSALHDVAEAIRLGSSEKHHKVTGFRLTSNVAITMLENGHPPGVMAARARRDFDFFAVVTEPGKQSLLNAYIGKIGRTITQADQLDIRPDQLDHDMRKTGLAVSPAARLIAQRMREGDRPESIALQIWAERAVFHNGANENRRLADTGISAPLESQFG